MKTNTMKQRTKKIVTCLLIAGLIASFAACSGGASGTLDFRSIACTETGRVASLGGRKADFDAAFGESEVVGNGAYTYLDGSLEVWFESGRAAGLQANVYPQGDRVEFYDLSWDMDLQELFDNLTPSELARDDGGIFNRFFDPDGNEVPQEESEYTLIVASFYPTGIVYVVLHDNH